MAEVSPDDEPEVESVPGIASRLPRKRIAAGALIRDGAGRFLLVEPVYKPTWDLPGGVVEADEPPLSACRRELLEELGLRLDVTRLLVIDWVPRQGPWHDALAFVFDGGVLAPGAAERICLPPEELRAVHLTTLGEAAHNVTSALHRRLDVALHAAEQAVNVPRYLHDGRVAR